MAKLTVAYDIQKPHSPFEPTDVSEQVAVAYDALTKHIGKVGLGLEGDPTISFVPGVIPGTEAIRLRWRIVESEQSGPYGGLTAR